MEECKVTQIHIPKTGGESVRESFGWPSVGHMTYQAQKSKEVEGDFVAMFRCPFDRAVSIYRYFQQATGVDFTLRKREDHLCHQEYIQAWDPGPSVYWEKINPEKIRPLTQHFRNQYWWIKGGEMGKDVHLYDFGDFENEVSRMAKDFGLCRKMSGIHTKKTKRKTTQEELSPKAIRRIAKFYRLDIEVMEKEGFPFTVDF